MVWQGFFALDINSKSIKGKINKWGHINLKSLCIANETTNTIELMKKIYTPRKQN